MKFKSFFSRLNVRMAAAFLIFSTIIISIFTGLSYSLTSNILKTDDIKKTNESIALAANYIHGYLDKLKSFSDIIAMHPDIINALNDTDASSLNSISSLIKLAKKSDPRIKSISVVSKTGHVITVPLITDATGKKFGKSEGNAVWLNADKTSPYEMYQFWMNVMDADAVRFLKIFTLLPLDEIEEIRKQFEAAPHERLAQKILAREVVTLVHGEEAYKEALNITEQLFAGNIKNLSVKELKQGLRGVPNYQVKVDDNLNIVEMLVTAGIVNSKRQAREDVQNGAIYVNGERIQDLNYTLTDADKLENELTVIRRGKKKYFVLTY